MPPTKTTKMTMAANRRGGSHDMNAGTIMYAAVKPINTNCTRIDHSLWKSRQFGSNQRSAVAGAAAGVTGAVMTLTPEAQRQEPQRQEPQRAWRQRASAE